MDKMYVAYTGSWGSDVEGDGLGCVTAFFVFSICRGVLSVSDENHSYLF